MAFSFALVLIKKKKISVNGTQLIFCNGEGKEG